MKKIVRISFILLIVIVIGVYFLINKEYYNKKRSVEKEELEYGNNYQVFKCEVYKEEPSRIIIKKLDSTNEFYIFDKSNVDYNHILKVALDRMYYSSAQDFNYWCFTPYLIEEISNSNENFLIFEYDVDNKDKDYMYDIDFNRDIIFRYSKDTRLYRLIDYLTYRKTKYNAEELRDAINKNEFVAENQIISGYKYMHPSLNLD